MKNSEQKSKEITRKEALKKLGKYSKYAALTALGTYVVLNPKKVQAFSGGPATPGDDWGS
ncbi:hypothetical protein KO506_00360 [Polaribacter vadi]|uniref:hypothetical protein n=1 Tax=Polaribacter TaxID=52959 RepID=UPI001C09A333|nr:MULTISPECIES: hypothetical protein [Polaribacter]MBU3009851.1 hypothetical protein [Polaribacter vadi]MDO6739657.1 hypothetical protein [Polaribacter sp. 1_MG-2023]